MLRRLYFLIILFCIYSSNLQARTVLGDLFRIYKTYKTINSGLWLTGDIGAEKRLGKELKMWMKI